MAEPLPICYLNGEYQQLRDARISPLDRAFLFGDSVYEVLPVFGGRMFRFREHFDRLARSLDEIRLRLAAHARAMARRSSSELIAPQRRRRHVRLRAGHARHGIRPQSRVSRPRSRPACSRWRRRCRC